ncbi:MAG: phosphatidate cytidylyltransferase [Gammaproteobacteria bacterium]|jgi:phosphatidate cytidylyltransferase|nr:phosphatidate cytidylyltransferase [Gammaproteobacteria bacterium]
MLKQRIITAIVLALTFIIATMLFSPFVFSLFIALIVLIAAWEWAGLIGLSQHSSKVSYLATLAVMTMALFPFLGVYPEVKMISSDRTLILLGLGILFWMLAFLMLFGYPENSEWWNDKSKIAVMGLMALLPACAGIIQLKYLDPMGYLVLALVIMVAAADIGAYFAGKKFGRRKLAPALSPNKSWEGVWGSLVACLFLGLLLIALMNNYVLELSPQKILALMVLSLCVTLFDVIGDLLESMLKRNQNIKDSSSILPGHGGILDRIDGLLAVTPLFVITFLIIG